MAWNLDCYGLEYLDETQEDRQKLLVHIAKHAESFKGYRGIYLNYYMDSVQYCLSAVKNASGQYEVINMDVHNTGREIWTCRVRNMLRCDEDNPLSRRIMVSTEDNESFAVVELINSDILPSYEEGEIIRFQVTGQALRVHYYENEEEFIQAEGIEIKDHPVLKPGKMVNGEGMIIASGFLNQHMVRKDQTQEREIDPEVDSYSAVRGTVKRLRIYDVKLGDQMASRYIECMIDTQFGKLPIVHSLSAVPAEERKRVKEGAVISVVCGLSGDVLIDDYDQGIVLDEENNRKLLRSCFNSHGNWERLRVALADNCRYESEGSGKRIQGKDDIIAFLEDRERKQIEANVRYDAVYATLEKPICDTEAYDGEEGKEVVVLFAHGEERWLSVVFSHTNEEGLIDEIFLSQNDRHRIRIHD